MNSKVVASKNTGMYYQGFTAELEKDSPLAYTDFITLVKSIMAEIDKLDTLNPDNSYGIDNYFADLEATSASDYELTIAFTVYFSLANSLKTVYAFEDSVTSVGSIYLTLLDGICDACGYTHVGLPDVLITNVEVAITVTEVTPITPDNPDTPDTPDDNEGGE